MTLLKARYMPPFPTQMALTFPYLPKRFFKSAALVFEERPLTHKLRVELVLLFPAEWRPQANRWLYRSRPQKKGPLSLCSCLFSYNDLLTKKSIITSFMPAVTDGTFTRNEWILDSTLHILFWGYVATCKRITTVTSTHFIYKLLV